MKKCIFLFFLLYFLLSTFPSFLSVVCFDQDDYRKLRSAHFNINYHKSVNKSCIRDIKKTSEKFYRVITHEFHLVRDDPWLWENKAKIFVAKDQKDYVDKFNCPAWSAACVNYREKLIYTYPGQADFDTIFIHELAHIIFREYMEKSRFPLWLDEGMAVYVEDKYGKPSYRNNLFFLKDKIKKGDYIKFSELNKVTAKSLNGESSDYIKLFYFESYSIISFLKKRYRPHSFSNFLYYLKKGYNIEDALSNVFYHFPNLEELEKQWKKFYRK